jgi:beta-lactam-binding protein with PASTA domain
MLRASWRPLSAVIMIIALAMSTVLVTPEGASAGTGHAARHMPSLVGLTRAQVYAVMRKDALYFVTKGPGSSNASWREVVAQSPAPGTVVAWHFQATLTTSLASPHGPRAVPRLIGLSRAQTYAAMRRAQLFFTTSGPGSSDAKWVVVLRQTPAPGTRVRWHAEVALAVSTVRPHHKAIVKKPVKKKPAPVKKKPVRTTCTGTTTTTTTTSTTSATTTTVPTSTTTYPAESTTTSTTTTPPPPTTTTTICIPVTTTTIKKKPVKYRIGDATWYSYIPGRCATWYLPYGTRITIRDIATGKVVHCIVTDREAAHGNRVVDLDPAQFRQLAPLWRGVVAVKVSW